MSQTLQGNRIKVVMLAALAAKNASDVNMPVFSIWHEWRLKRR